MDLNRRLQALENRAVLTDDNDPQLLTSLEATKKQADDLKQTLGEPIIEHNDGTVMDRITAYLKQICDDMKKLPDDSYNRA